MNYELRITTDSAEQITFNRLTVEALNCGLCGAQKQTALRAETQTRLCESERRKTANCLSRRRVFAVQRTSTPSGSARCVQP